MNASSLPKLDAVTIEALVQFRTAIRLVRSLERADVRAMSAAAKGIHDRKLEKARYDLRQRRVALEQVLEET